MVPETKNIGAKAQSVVAIVVRTGRHTWYVPSIAACSGDSPSCQREYMLSDTMIASSTMIPRTMIMDVNVMVSRNESKKGNRNIAPMKVNGIPIATQIDRVKFMNKRRIKITRENPMIPFQSTMPKKNIFTYVVIH